MACKSIPEASFVVEFSEPSAFHRPFKRWTGLAPAEYPEAQLHSRTP